MRERVCPFCKGSGQLPENWNKSKRSLSDAEWINDLEYAKPYRLMVHPDNISIRRAELWRALAHCEDVKLTTEYDKNTGVLTVWKLHTS